MCGIAGIVNFDINREVDGAVIERMCEVIKHRGPDENGFYISGNVGFGMQRLSIIDLDTGRQPIHNEDRSVWIVYNGETYNYLELRDELIKKGHRFYTSSDTEVVVHLYEEFGMECVKRLRGMFAFAIWDERAKRLLVARDRIGIKPLHYMIDKDRIIFASEIKSILAAGVKREIDPAGLDGYFTFNYVPAPYTIFKGIKKLLPGHILKMEGGKVSEEQYWDIDYTKKSSKGMDEIMEELLDILKESVRMRLRSDVPFGAFLSGGIDSSTVVALMSEIMDMPVKTFSIGFEEKDYNELDYARLVARRFDTDHHEFIVKPDFVDLLPRLVWHFDEPFGDVSAVPTYYVSKLAREHVTMVLSGDGGDELFAGYTRYPKERFTNYYSYLPRWFRKNIIRQILQNLPVKDTFFKKRIERFLWRADLHPLERYKMAVGIFSEEMKEDVFKYVIKDTQGLLFDNYFNSDNTNTFIDRLLYTDLKTYLPDDILVKVDRMSMANSLESRVPILDHKFVEFAAALPDGYKLKGFTMKHIFKKTVSKFLPKEIIYRKKKGFGIPIAVWFRNELKNFAQDILFSNEFKQRGFFNQKSIESMFKMHQDGTRDFSEHLWTFLIFELWCREYMSSGVEELGS